MGDKKKSKSLYWSLLKMTIIPIFLLTLVITSFSAKSFASGLSKQVQKELMDLDYTILTLYDQLYPGDFNMTEKDDAIYFFKGEHQLNGEFSIIDSIKEKTGADITLFYQDVRIITTLRDHSGQRIIGTKVNSVVKKDVIETGKAKFYPQVSIGDSKYFAYYSPLMNHDGTVMGMLFIAQPVTEVNKSVWHAIMPIIIIALIAMLFAGIFTIRFSEKLVMAIKKIELFLEKVAKGNLSTSIDQEVLIREDELGDMGRNTVNMQKALRELVEQDLLTNLHNRRYGEKKLKQVQEAAFISGAPFCVAIGDIDYFKKINDTYGHECGDIVLINVSQKLKKHMAGKGFAARWGGEEFLLVYEMDHINDAASHIQHLIEEIRAMRITYKDKTDIGVTMTFGIAEGSNESMDFILRLADEKLYEGKNNGRNQVL